ncbi:MAG: hypothetical protein MZU95_16160 [Desulfomicrobium escambiense]|nr:hypothetical protein [Desulfomicrobium escambiense]
MRACLEAGGRRLPEQGHPARGAVGGHSRRGRRRPGDRSAGARPAGTPGHRHRRCASSCSPDAGAMCCACCWRAIRRRRLPRSCRSARNTSTRRSPSSSSCSGSTHPFNSIACAVRSAWSTRNEGAPPCRPATGPIYDPARALAIAGGRPQLRDATLLGLLELLEDARGPLGDVTHYAARSGHCLRGRPSRRGSGPSGRYAGPRNPAACPGRRAGGRSAGGCATARAVPAGGAGRRAACAGRRREP